MFSKRSLPIVLLFLVTGFLIAFNSSGFGNPPDKFKLIFTQVAEMLEQAHYNPKKIDDNFSKQIFKKYLESLDPDKNIFLATDIKELKKYELSIDDELHGSDFQFFYASEQIFSKRVKQLSELYPELLKKPFKFDVDESIITDADKLDYPKNDNARVDVWRKRLKYLKVHQEKYHPRNV